MHTTRLPDNAAEQGGQLNQPGWFNSQINKGTRPTHRPGVYPAALCRPGGPPRSLGWAWGGWFS